MSNASRSSNSGSSRSDLGIKGESLSRNRADVSGADFDAQQEKTWQMMKACKFALLTTVSPDGSLRSRPMTTVQEEFGGTLWFFAPRDSEPSSDVEQNEQVSVSYANPDKSDFVCLSGTASVVNENIIKRKLWNPMVQAWFPQGPDAPDVVLIKADINHAEYWDSTSNKASQLFSMASALIKGTHPKDVGTHRELKM